MAADGDQDLTSQRTDVWLCNARFCKSRTLAQELIGRGKVRVNRERIQKPSHALKTGDVITISLGPRVRVLKVESFAVRRGPATKAQELYTELTPDREPAKANGNQGASAPLVIAQPQAVRERGAGRPTKRDRRDIDRLRNRSG